MSNAAASLQLATNATSYIDYLYRVSAVNEYLVHVNYKLIPLGQLIDYSRDCFGREKHAEYRDDMGGVGSFNRANRTLYIGKMQESPDKKQTEETMLRHFGEWGKIVKCKSSPRGRLERLY